MKTLAEITGENIRVRRLKLCMSQEVLSGLIGAGNQTVVSSWEHGRRCPTAVYLYNLADVFGCSVDSLMGRDVDA